MNILLKNGSGELYVDVKAIYESENMEMENSREKPYQK